MLVGGILEQSMKMAMYPLGGETSDGVFLAVLEESTSERVIPLPKEHYFPLPSGS